MTEEVLISARSVSKKYCRSLKRSLWYGAQDIASELMSRKALSHNLRKNEFWAVDDVTFDVRRGECVGLIGRNGAGKTTLLKMLNGIVKPDRGQILVKGRVGGLIALGAGFSPILTGRENIYVNGSILGFTKKEIDAKFDEIVAFSEMAHSIDAPVQTYSSGMSVRLGFSIAAVLLKPQVLLLDEVLAVGDIGFTVKCLNAVRSLCEHSAVVFVSHNLQYVSSFCNRVIVMQEGTVIKDAYNPSEGIDTYLAQFPTETGTSGTGQVTVESIHVIDKPVAEGAADVSVSQGESLSIGLLINMHEGFSETCRVRLYVMDEGMNPIICFPLLGRDGHYLNLGPGKHEVAFSLGPVDLNSGKYSLTVSAQCKTGVTLARVQGLLPFRVTASEFHWGQIVRPVSTILNETRQAL